jgi:hypothetical protein
MAGSALSVCPAPEIVPGERRVVSAAGAELLVLNCAGELFEVFPVEVIDDVVTVEIG